MSRLGRFRKTDAFALVGILMLVVWTPAYVAQEDEARVYSRGQDFVVPERRVGDSITYGLVIQPEGGEPRSFGPVQRITFERAGADAAPVPAAFVETRVTSAWTETVDGLRFEALPFEDRQFFAENGTMVWRSLRIVQSAEGERPQQYIEAGARTAGTADDDLKWFDGNLEYVPNQIAATFIKASRDIIAEFSGPPHADMRLLADRVAGTDGRPVYGILTANDAESRIAQALTGQQQSARYHGYGGLAHLALRIPNTQVSTVDGEALVGEASWLWASPDSARPVGSHDRVRAADGTVYGIDVVPLAVVRGDGPTVPWVHGPDHIFGVTPRLALPPRTDLVRTPLSMVEQDRAPLFENASLADLRDLLATSGPESIQSALSNGARIIEFLLAPGVRTSEAGSTETPLLPVDPSAADEVIVKRSNWTLGLLGPDGERSVANVWLEERPGPRFTAVVEDGCTGAEPHHACSTPWSDAVDWSRRVVAPGAIAAAAADDADEAGFLRHYAPLAWCGRHPSGSSLLNMNTCRHDLIDTIGDGSNMEWYNVRHETSGKATWRSDDPNGMTMRYDLVDGYADAQWSKRLATPADAEPLAPNAAASMQAPAVLDVVGTHAAWGGLGLLLASVAFRVGAALKAGAHLPLLTALFSRISRADALLNERRGDIIELLRADPGLTTQEVATRLGYSRTATLHHLETLMRTGQLMYVQNGQQRHYFPPDGTERERVRWAVSRDEQYASLLSLVDAAPGITLAELTERMGRSKSRLSRMSARLVRLGVLRRERDGRALRLFPASHSAGS